MRKVCTRCQEEKEITDFYKCKNGKNGVMSICKKCDNARATTRLRKKSINEGIKQRRLTLDSKEDRKNGKKQCPLCNRLLNISSFYSNKASHDGCSSHCEECSRKIAKNVSKEQLHQYYLNRKRKQRNAKLLRDFGITIEQYEDILSSQDHKCAICGKTEEDNKKSLAVDHCHETLRIRGLLCNNCNVAIGFLGDSIEKAMKSIEYLKNN